MVEVPDRTRQTLERLILQYINPGSHIMSDGWAAYANIDQINGGIYSHDVIVHQHNFVDPNDPSIHTQTVENLWQRAKRRLKEMYGTDRQLFESHLMEFAWKQHFRGACKFASWLDCVSEIF